MFCVLAFTAASPQLYPTHKDQREITDEFQNIYAVMQKKVRKIDREPALAEMEDLEIFASTTTNKAYLRIGNDRYEWSITKI